MGGVLGGLLLISIGGVCFLLGQRRERTRSQMQPAEPGAVRYNANVAGEPKGPDTEFGGRLRYPGDGEATTVPLDEP